MNFFIKAISKLFKKKYEYLYFYVLGSDVYGLEQNVREKLFNSIQLAAKDDGKRIVDYEFYTDKKSYESVVILTTTKLTEKNFYPLILEIYAYIKSDKNLQKISYKYEETTHSFLKGNYDNAIYLKDGAKTENVRYIIVYKFKINVR